MNAAETVKDTCAHAVQCVTQEECDAKSKADTTHAGTLGERLVRAALEDSAAERARTVTVVVPEGQLWRWTGSYAALDRSLSGTGTCLTRALAWMAVHQWVMFQLSDDGELPDLKSVKPPEVEEQVPSVPDFIPGSPTFETVEKALAERGYVLKRQEWALWGDLQRQNALRWALNRSQTSLPDWFVGS